MSTRTPLRYRVLLATYPPAWRRRNGDAAIDTLLEVHAAAGRTRPSVRDSLQFLLGGLLARLPHRRRRRPLAPWRPLPPAETVRFDQGNGRIAEPSDELDRHGMRIDRQWHTGEGDSTAPGGTPILTWIHGGGTTGI